MASSCCSVWRRLGRELAVKIEKGDGWRYVERDTLCFDVLLGDDLAG